MLQESSSGNGVKGIGVAVTGGRGASQKAVANVWMKGNEDRS